MREQRAQHLLRVVVRERAFGGAVVAGLVVFEPVGRDVVREREQEVVVLVVPGAEERLRLGDETLVVRDVPGPIATDAALSPARCSQWPGFSPGVRSTVFM